MRRRQQLVLLAFWAVHARKPFGAKALWTHAAMRRLRSKAGELVKVVPETRAQHAQQTSIRKVLPWWSALQRSAAAALVVLRRLLRLFCRRNAGVNQSADEMRD